jgi:uncharacterized protein YecE (DUF72 family)
VAVDGDARVGCSGYSYKDWRGAVYPAELPARAWLDCYTSMFDTVELNTTFYRLPAASMVERWAAAAPPAFVYALKVGQFGTHRKKLKDPESWMATHVERFQPLGAVAGPQLFQLPPHWHVDTGRLDAVLDVARALAPTWRWAVEVRDPTWLCDDVYAVLAHHDAALCIHDLLPDHPWVRTAPGWTYIRFHGPDAANHAYVGRYTGRRLAAPAARLAAWMGDGCDVYAYFNNDFGGAAVHDAEWLRQRLTAG